MEVYILDDQLRRIEVFDRFESMIWTERYNAFGDFQLVIYSSSKARSLFVNDTWISITSSKRVMTIDNVLATEDSDGKNFLTITGRSMEAWMLGRVNRRNLSSTSAPGPLTQTGTPYNIATALFSMYCINNTFIPEDNLPFYTAGTLYPADTIPMPTTQYTVEFDIEPVYDSIKNLLDMFDMGFRIYKGPDTSKLYFNVYSGSDRTSRQTTRPAIIFSPDLDNLTNVADLRSKEDYRNVAYVFGKNGSRIVYASGASASTTGFERRVMHVSASDIDLPAGSALDAALLQRGNKELSKARTLHSMDGEISQLSEYKYDSEYCLGDIVEIRRDDGYTNYMRVTEQIFVDDGEGERSYPTLDHDV